MSLHLCIPATVLRVSWNNVAKLAKTVWICLGMIANMGPSGNCETNTGPDVASFRVMLQVVPGQASEGLLQNQQQNQLGNVPWSSHQMNHAVHTNKVHLVNLPQNVGPYENYKRIVKGVFFFGQVVGWGCEFWQPGNRKEEKMGTSPLTLWGEKKPLSLYFKNSFQHVAKW